MTGLASDKKYIDILDKLGMVAVAYSCSDGIYEIYNWGSIKKFMWENFKLEVHSESFGRFGSYAWLRTHAGSECDYSLKKDYDSPISAEIDGIKDAIVYLNNIYGKPDL